MLKDLVDFRMHKINFGPFCWKLLANSVSVTQLCFTTTYIF